MNDPDRRLRAVARRAGLRTAFLLIGAAIFFGFAVVDVGLVNVAWQARPDLWSVLVLAPVIAVPPALLAFLPGVRELEVVATRALLGQSLGAATSRDRRTLGRTAVFVVAHVLLGGAAGGLLVIVLPSVALMALPGGGAAILLRLAGAAAAVGAVVLLGLVAALLAPVLLGPTDRDRLVVAEERLRADAEHLRLARDLHDGIGHALSIISLQAAAGRRILARDPGRADEAFAVVVATARDAAAELDQMIGVLRDDTAASSGSTLGDVEGLVASYRVAGLRIDTDLGDTSSVPAFASREAYRIVQEGLTNAHRHGAGTEARLTIGVEAGTLVIDVVNPAGAAPAVRAGGPVVGGHGLAGLRERAAVFGGRVTAGRDADRWRLRAELPLGLSRG